MTIDEHIHKAEEDAKMAEFDTVWGIGNYFIDRTEALEYAKGCRQLAEWLKDYKRLKEQEPSVSENPNNCDLISREKVCDYIAEFINHEYSTQSECEMVDSMIDGIQHMPSVKPQERTGHWKRISMDKYSEHSKYWYRCNRCGKDNLGNTDWCPNCGAKMVEPQERSEDDNY